MTNLATTQLAPTALQDARASNTNEPPPPARLARLFSKELVGEAQEVFARRLQREVSENEARMMLANLTGFFRLLAATN